MPPSASVHEFGPSLRYSLRFRVGLLGMAILFAVAMLRFLLGQAVVAWIDLAWASGLALVIGWLVRGARPSRVGFAMAAISLAFSCVKVPVLGLPGLFWLLPVVLGAFAVAERRAAVVLSVAALAIASVFAFDEPRREVAVSFAAAGVLVLAIAWVSAAYVESLRLRLEELASRDALTGAGNRRALEQALGRLPHRGDERDALAVLDLDHFKQVNDRHGHAAGDRVLSEVAILVQQLLRPQDRLFRLGGEEFVLLMPGIGAEEARGLLALVGQAVRQKVRVRQEPVTASIGLALWRSGEGAAEWIARADAALYRAKAAGRDRLEEAGDAPAGTAAVPASA